jgi:hypothetical protein
MAGRPRFGDLQNEIYLSDARPALPIGVNELQVRGPRRDDREGVGLRRRRRAGRRSLVPAVDVAAALIALALGARAVLLGRPWVYGLALAGQDGVTHVLRHLLADLELTMVLAGYASPAELSADSLVRDRS